MDKVTATIVIEFDIAGEYKVDMATIMDSVNATVEEAQGHGRVVSATLEGVPPTINLDV